MEDLESWHVTKKQAFLHGAPAWAQGLRHWATGLRSTCTPYYNTIAQRLGKLLLF
jgi:hypothetical protein